MQRWYEESSECSPPHEEWARIAEAEPDRADVRTPDTMNVLNEMIVDTLPAMEFDADATADEITTQLSAALGLTITQICSAFMCVHSELARVYDDTDPDRSSGDVLRELALDADRIWPPGN